MAEAERDAAGESLPCVPVDCSRRMCGVRTFDEHAAPLFIRLLSRFPALCLLLWVAVPVALAVLIVPSLSLTDPQIGWRMKQHKTAEALDAIILASRTAGPSTLPLALRQNLTANLPRRRLSGASSASASSIGPTLHVNPLPMPWEAAKRYCELFGGSLASVNSAADNAAVLEALHNEPLLEGETTWLGGSDIALEGTWVWASDGRAFSQLGQPFDDAFVRWNFGEPNDWGNGEDCLEMRIDDGTWNDRSCQVPIGSVCQGGNFPPSPPPLPLPLQSRPFGFLRLAIAPSEPGADLLTPEGVAQAIRLEEAAAELLSDFCLLDYPPGYETEATGGDPTAAAASALPPPSLPPSPPRRCVPPRSFTNLFRRPRGDEVGMLCDPNASGVGGNAGGFPDADACVQRRLRSAAFVESSASDAMTHQSEVTTIAQFLAASNYSQEFLASAASFASVPGIDAQWLTTHYQRGDIYSAGLWESPFTFARLAAAAAAIGNSAESDPPTRAALTSLESQMSATRGELDAMSERQRVDLDDLLQEHRVAQRAESLYEVQRYTLQTTHGLHYQQLVQDAMGLLPNQLLWGLSNNFNISSAVGGGRFRAGAALSELALGFPIRGYGQSLAHGADQMNTLRARMLHFDEDLQRAARRLEREHGFSLDVAWELCGRQSCNWVNWLGKRTLWFDMCFALTALGLAFACICLHTRSLLLGVLGALQIAASFPLALFIYRGVLGITLFGVLHVIGIFVILGIGCDDLFVMNDAWVQSAWLAPPAALSSIDRRLWWAYRRAGKAMFVTTMTDVGAFLSSLVCVVPNIVSFAIFTSLLAVANLALVLTLWPCALLLHHRLVGCIDRCCFGCRRPQISQTTQRTSLPSTPSAARTSSTADASTPHTPTRDCSSESVEVQDATPAASPSASPSPPAASPHATAAPVAAAPAARENARRRRRPKPRLIEWWYAHRYVPWLRKGRRALCLVLFFGFIACALVPSVLKLEGPKRDVMVWPSWHNSFKYLTMRDTHFAREHKKLHIVWGTRGVDRSAANPWDESDLGEVVWDDTFDLADPAAQAALLRACTVPLDDPALRIAGTDGGGELRDDDHLCIVHAMSTWAALRNVSFPIPREQFSANLLAFLASEPKWLASLSFAQAQNGDGVAWRVRHVAISFTLDVEPHAPASRRRLLYDRWEQLVDELNDAAPPTAKHASQSASTLWIVMALQELLVRYALLVVVCSVAVGFVFVLLATRSLLLSLLCTLTISAVVASWSGVLLLCGAFDQGLGIVESLVLMVSVGLMLDPITHVAFAFSEARGTPEERLASALSVIGISVLASCVSTAGSCAIMAVATIVLFSRFALLFCSLMGVTLLYANAFLAPLLLILGPSAAHLSGNALVRSRAWPRSRWGRPRRALTEADAAASTNGPSSPASVASQDSICDQPGFVEVELSGPVCPRP